jgi:hypothetical protein
VRPTSLYVYYDAAGVVLYVGITQNGVWRNRDHNCLSKWWGCVARQEITHYPTREAALSAERDAILALKPLHNVQHAVKARREEEIEEALEGVSDPRIRDYMRRHKLCEYAQAEERLLTFALDVIDGRRKGGTKVGNRPEQVKHLKRARKAREK